MHRNLVLTSFVLLMSFSGLRGQEGSSGYLWPTDASEYLTSAFGEYRPRRFHTGIDVKTWGKVGYKCFAVRPGYVWRVSVSPNGYGKAVYLKLDTGEVAVYAHLSKFSPEIEQYVQAEQKRKGQYRINIFLRPDRLPVAQGDVIAFTGQTGIGAPHLHFEIRDLANRPTNPLLKGYPLPDNVKPIVRKISFTPIGPNSAVNGDFKPVVISPQWIRPGSYEIKEPVAVWGKVGLAISCYDKSFDSSNRYGTYAYKLYVDDELRFEYRYDRLAFQSNAMIELERDYRLSRRRFGRFNKLYKDEYNGKSYYKPNKTWAGVLQSANLATTPSLISHPGHGKQRVSQKPEIGALFPGEHEFRIETSDFFGNTSTVVGRVHVGSPYDIHPVLEQDENGDLVLQQVVTYDMEQISDVDVYLLNRSRWRELPFEWPIINPDSLQEKGGDTTMAEPLDDYDSVVLTGLRGRTAAVLKIQGRDQFSVPSYPFYYVHSDVAENTPPPELAVEYDFYDDYVRLEVKVKDVLQSVPVVKLYPGRWDARDVPLHQVDLKRYVGRVELGRLNGNEHALEITAASLSGEQFVFYDGFHAEKIDPGATDRVVSSDRAFWVNFGRRSLYRSIYTRIFVDSVGSAGKLDAIGNIYSIEPKDALMKRGALVNLHYPDSTERPEKLGVYYRGSRGRWIFIDNQLDEKAQVVSAKVLSFEDFTLIRDEIAPEISQVRPASNARLRNRTPLISATVRDRLSGIRSEKDLEIRLDGKRIIAAYDPERHRLAYKVAEPLQPGEHEIMVMALDKCKNVSIHKTSFSIQ